MTAEILAETHAAAFSDARPWAAEEFESLLTQPSVILCGDAKSFLLGRLIMDEAEVLTLATHPQFQRQGRALAQLLIFCAKAKSNGAKYLFLEVSDSNHAGKALYANAKFEITGRRPKYFQTKSGAWDDAITMRLTL